MIFVGDIVSPGKKYSKYLYNVFEENAKIFKNKLLVCNFEGLICDDIQATCNTPVLYNHSSVFESLKAGNVQVVGLANNHILDLPHCFDNTIKQLDSHGIVHTGASRNRKNALKPAFFRDGDSEVILFNACWNFLLYHQSNPTDGVYVSEIKEEELIKEIARYRNQYPVSSIIIFLHWSFDLETLPFPMYRQFSKKLIDEGANVVVGAHSHCVQGGEKYRNGYIVYGLGNFFFPNNTFVNSYLTFPDFARTQLAFDWDSKSETATCHWFTYQNEGENHSLLHIGSEIFDQSPILEKYSLYSKMTDNEYLAYFKNNRRKKFLIPIYKDYKAGFTNDMYTWFLKNRARFARFLAKFRLIKWAS